ncbi:MAG: protocatechuate 3,4-dioxygenase subunit beta [Alphaproteobacteria bacterium]|nr:protocatechuate 3,4-dioxygenase subunit beta [Alphaproteobacteria bacterium]
MRGDIYPRGALGDDPPILHPGYKSTLERAPSRPPVPIPQTLSELTGPIFGHDRCRPEDTDLTRQHAGAPQGERIIVAGKLLDEAGRPVAGQLVEMWQCNAAGRYRHPVDQHDAPLDPNFTGVGRAVTDAEGNWRFTTVKPGAYPWRNHPNAWRPAHLHFSLFGPSFMSRLVTQMFFPGDPLLALDPIFHGVPEHARDRLVAAFDLDVTQPEWALGYRWDIVLRGAKETPKGI